MKEIQVALIGCGRIAGHHARSITKVQGAKLAAVCDLIVEKAAAYGNEFNVPYYGSYREMLKSQPEIDTVAVITPSGMHYEHCTEILRHYRKHLVVEKPTFMRPSHANAAYQIADELGVRIFPVFQNRHNKAVARVRRGLQTGELGAIRIASVRVRWCRPQRYYDLAPWRGTFAMDGGALTNQGIHHIDLLRHFAGEPVRVNSLMRTQGANIEVEDTAVATVEFESGAVGTIEVTTAARPIDYEASLSLVCEKGLAQIGGIAVNELQVYTPEPGACLANSEDFSGNVYGHGHEALYQEIVRDLLGDVPFSVGRQDCTNTLRLLNSLYASDERGTWVRLEENVESRRLGREDESLAKIYRIQ